MEGTDRVGGQLCRDKECPFGGVTNSGTDSVSGQLNGDNECPFSGVTNLGADSIGGQLRGDKELYPFSGVTSSGRVWRKVPESDARSVPVRLMGR